ncbi:unnamed protein product [Owenia fusiformis]|uniref:Uncharacterized protein n=1 Tax=Owenia fusiformis TaxID=6347 RepID=A0A8J1TU35_OWEFU|nr:unnamed protein product [Owenia fusiformis]
MNLFFIHLSLLKLRGKLSLMTMTSTLFHVGFVLIISIAQIASEKCDPEEITNSGLCADIVFGFDTSCSINGSTKEEMKQFALEFVDRFSERIGMPDSENKATFTQFGLLRFDISASKVFGFGEAPTSDEVEAEIDEFDYAEVDCKTITHLALELAKTDFFESDKVDTRTPNILILLTDGRTQPQKFIDEMNRARAELNINNTYVLVVQVPNKNDKTDEMLTTEQLLVLAPLDEDRFTYDSTVDIEVLADQVYERIGEIVPCPACVSEDVPCDEADLDVLVIIDHSNSIISSNLEIVRNNTKRLVNAFENVGDSRNPEKGSVKFALISYNNRVNPILYFNSSGASTKEGTLEAIDNADLSQAKDTRTDLALKFADETIFNQDYGDRKEAQNVIVIFTDGRTMKAKFQNNTIKVAQKIKERMDGPNSTSVEIFLLGLPGANVEKNRVQREREWNLIPSQPLDKHFEEFKTFTEIEFFIAEVTRRICNIA